MNKDRLRDVVRNITQGVEIVGGTLVAIAYILTHPDQAMPEGGWGRDLLVEESASKGRQRFDIVKNLRRLPARLVTLSGRLR